MRAVGPLVHHARLDDVNWVRSHCCTEAGHHTRPAERNHPLTPQGPHASQQQCAHAKCAGKASLMAACCRRRRLHRSYAGRITPATTVARCMVGPTPCRGRRRAGQPFCHVYMQPTVQDSLGTTLAHPPLGTWWQRTTGHSPLLWAPPPFHVLPASAL